MCRDCERLKNILDLAVRWRRQVVSGTRTPTGAKLPYIELADALDAELRQRDLEDTPPIMIVNRPFEES